MPVAPPSTGFIETLRFGATLVLARVTIYEEGAPTTYEVPISVAKATVTRNSAQRRQLSMTAEITPTIPPPPLWPTSPASLLTPFGNEIYVETGIATADGSGGATVKQWMPLGLFSLSTITAQDTTNDATITIEGFDRSWVVSQRKFKGQYSVPATATGTFVAEIKHLLNQVWGSTPALRFNIVPTTAKVPAATFNQGTDPWTACLQMATAVGYELFFNVTGVVTGYPIPTPATQPVVWHFTDTPVAIYGLTGTGGSTTLEGSPYSTPIDCTVQFTRDGIFNDVLVVGTGQYNPTATGYAPTTPPVIGEAQTASASSPFRVTGPLGDIPEFVQTNLVASGSQASAAADNYLQAALSDAWQITLSLPPNPMFDIDDVVTVTRPRLGLTNVKMVIDSIEHSLSYATVTKLTGRVLV